MTSNPLSTTAAEILDKRGRWWEFELFAQLLIEGIVSHTNSYQPRTRDPMVFIADSRANLAGYMAWLKGKIHDVPPLVEAFGDLVMQKAEWAFGATGEPGNADNIAKLALEAVRLYRKAEDFLREFADHEWKLSEHDGIFNAIMNDYFFKMRDGLSWGIANILRFYEGYGIEVLRRIREARERSERGEDVSLDLRVNFKVEVDPEGVIADSAVALQRYADSVEERLSRARQENESVDQTYSTDRLRGYLYILMNPAMPGLIKIGKTTRRPTDRTRELSAATGVPVPFVVIYELMVDDCHQAEKRVHETLDHYRVNDGREFFKMATSDAIDVMHAVKLTVANS